MPKSQTASGKSFEYALALECSDLWGVEIIGEAVNSTRKAYFDVTESDRVERHQAAQATLAFLSARDNRLNPGNLESVELQPDNVARYGDVRDLVLRTRTGMEIGLSAKNRNRAMRNPRISPRYDFGERWFGSTNSEDYRETIRPVWEFIEPMYLSGQMWPGESIKNEKIYLPALAAFIEETRRIFRENPLRSARHMMSYMRGIADYYMVYKQNGDVLVQSFNMHETLAWGRSFPIPTRLVELEMKPDNETTAIMVLDAGWQLSFRIHSADKLVRRSLKYTVKIEGQPAEIAQHFIDYRAQA